MERLRGYSWPGNIRELQSVLQQALLQASGTVLLPAFLTDDLLRDTQKGQRRTRRCPITARGSRCPSSSVRRSSSA